MELVPLFISYTLIMLQELINFFYNSSKLPDLAKQMQKSRKNENFLGW